MSLLSLEDAFARIVGDVVPIGDTESLPLRRCSGRVLAADIVALRTQPGFDASAMDGYAVRAEDLAEPFTPLALIGESAAGNGFAGTIESGTCARIFTGAPMPAGADAVLIQENAERVDAKTILPLASSPAGRHIRRAGADFKKGEVLLTARTLLNAGKIAVGASAGHPELTVVRRPRVAILATGDELVLPGEAVGPAQIVSSNSFGIAAMVEGAGGEVLDYGLVRDDLGAIGTMVDRARDEAVDILVTSGGASVGDHDLVGDVFASRGVLIDFWKIAMRPGKPLMAGRLGPMRLLGLPGNPASSLVTATLFLQPLVKALLGLDPAIAYRNGILGEDLPANDQRADFLRATVGEASAVMPILSTAGRQDSSLLSVFAKADALLVREPFAPAAKAGEPCRFISLD
ncbi:molybdopterin molybdotransferase MoeA [Aureimonas psammosilenae]|uniref:molybdopterin molybdotransferase MoeA n=1 Tax=Aureimonas psammosilenae TaxID=2495496 RepID=UPI001261241E|nr:gephyrin-like molybdotransferase Glp [Aureimonas psammosilenae]